MTPEFHSQSLSCGQTEYGALGFDPWAAEIATRQQAALTIARGVYRVVELVADGIDLIAAGIEKLRAAKPVEIEPVEIARPAQPARTTASVDRAAA